MSAPEDTCDAQKSPLHEEDTDLTAALKPKATIKVQVSRFMLPKVYKLQSKSII